jgi:phosphate transport system substrate-binding protein
MAAEIRLASRRSLQSEATFRHLFVTFFCYSYKMHARNCAKWPVATLALAAMLALTACGGETTPKDAAGPVSLKGAGATAPFLAYSKWVEEYKKVEPSLDLQYQPTGSGDGIRQLQAGTVDFAATDIPLTDEEAGKLKVKPLHFPTLVGAIVPVYNVPEVGSLQFSGETLAGIFSNTIKTWNDPALAKTNSGVALPASRITVIHRSDASGSTYALTDFFCRISDPWKTNIGQGATVNWPAGKAAEGNEGVAELVKKTPNSIGYVELNYAVTLKLPYGAVKNASGNYQKPEIEALGEAVDAALNMKKDFRISIVNAPAKKAYPICTLTWLIVPSQFNDARKTAAMKKFLRWCYDDGQKLVSSMEYDAIPSPLLNYVRDQVADIH